MTDLVDPNPERSAELLRELGYGPRYFGTPWGPAIDDLSRMIPTPVGNACGECGELIAVDDLGIVMSEIIQVADPDADESDVLARVVVQHRECFMFAILGSPACQRRECTCASDAPEHRRQRARDALAHWEATRLAAFAPEGAPRVLKCEGCGAPHVSRRGRLRRVWARRAGMIDDRRTPGDEAPPTLAEIRDALAAGGVTTSFNPWAALRVCVAEFDAREADSRELHGEVDLEARAAYDGRRREHGEDGEGRVVVSLNAPLLVRFAILRQQLPELGKLARSFTLDELHQLLPHAARLVLLIDGTIEHYRAEEERAGRRL